MITTKNPADMKPGKLVRLRQRDWIVQPSDDPDVLRIKPLGGAEEEVTGIYVPFGFENEDWEEVFFPLPAADDHGDLASARLLYDAVRLGFRDASGPFRSVAKFNFSPRAYQMVPLIMALKQEDPVRLFIADDVGIGKTVESLMVARELIDRGRVQRLAIVCPPHLCEQWQREMAEKFGIEAVIIRSSTAATLDRKTPGDTSAFAYYPYQVVSIDYIKSDKRRDSFIADCPDLVIVDEVHTASSGEGKGRQQRHYLLKGVSAKPDQHLLLLSATPHSGKPEEFRSILALLKKDFEQIDVSEMTSRERKSDLFNSLKDDLKDHFVQRRRADIKKWNNVRFSGPTVFPERVASEVAYPMSPEYLELQYDVMQLAHTIAGVETAGKGKNYLNYWTALGLLRGVMSSPAAGIYMLENRAAKQLKDNDEQEDFLPERNPVLDYDDEWGDDNLPPLFNLPSAPASAPDYKHELSEKLANIRDQGLDLKVKRLIKLVKKWQKEGFHPIVYCHYIPTAEYVGDELRKALPDNVGVATVTGNVADEAREEAVEELSKKDKRVLVATNCMSEGINLQRHFTAVIHYDLPWNPNRLEQREGRVDRFGQAAPEVRIAMLYGKDNPMDGIVLKVLLRKAREIKKAIGVSVPFPENNQSIMEAVTQAVLKRRPEAKQLGMFENIPEVAESAQRVEEEFKRIADDQKAAHSVFAQQAIKAQEIETDLEQAIRLIGDMDSVEQFTLRAINHLNGNWKRKGEGFQIEKLGLPQSLFHLFDGEMLDVSFTTPTPEGFRYIARNHPLVDTLGQLLMDEALTGGTADDRYRVRRTAVVRSTAVERTTTLLLLRVRNVIESVANRSRQLVAEELLLRGYRGSPPNVEWIPEPEALALLKQEATGEVSSTEKEAFILDALDDIQRPDPENGITAGPLHPALNTFGREQAEALVEAHDRFRAAVKGKRFQVVEPILPMDIMGIYVFVPDLT